MNYTDDPFFQYPTTVFSSSQGEVSLPILYFDTRNMVAMFWVEYTAAAALIDDPDLRLVRFRGNKALATVAFFEYRDTTVGVYNEVGVALAVTPRCVVQPAWPLLSLYRAPDRRQIGFHILDLPVTTAAACAAGREIWGFPKFITPISFAQGLAGFDGVVQDPDGGGPVLTLAGRAGLGLPAPPLSLVLYSRHADGALLRSIVNVRGGVHACLPGSLRLHVGSSTHAMGQRLVALGLNDARPFLVQQTDAFQSRLNQGARLPLYQPRQVASAKKAA